GDSLAATLYHQAGASAAGAINLGIFLDLDFNPYNGNEIAVEQTMLSRTGTSAVSRDALDVTVSAAAVPPGNYAVYARLNDGGRTRYLYAPQVLVVTPSLQPPSIDAGSLALNGGTTHLNVHAFPGQTVTVLGSIDLVKWMPLQTHTFTGTIWEFVETGVGNFDKRFYRASLAP
nr:hypothetical protein [Verrucomicrobiota bacterium]